MMEAGEIRKLLSGKFFRFARPLRFSHVGLGLVAVTRSIYRNKIWRVRGKTHKTRFTLGKYYR
jgi:hypothetical protein